MPNLQHKDWQCLPLLRNLTQTVDYWKWGEREDRGSRGQASSLWQTMIQTMTSTTLNPRCKHQKKWPTLANATTTWAGWADVMLIKMAHGDGCQKGSHQKMTAIKFSSFWKEGGGWEDPEIGKGFVAQHIGPGIRQCIKSRSARHCTRPQCLSYCLLL